MRRWMKVVFCFLFGIIFTNMFTMDQAVADESFGKREISAESSVLNAEKTSSVRYGNNDILRWNQRQMKTEIRYRKV